MPGVREAASDRVEVRWPVQAIVYCAAQAFVKALGERIRSGRLRVQGVPTSEETANLTRQHSTAEACGGGDP
jgi:hypothetical protein